MEGLTPSLRFVLVLRENLERGDSVRNAVRDFVHNYPSRFAEKVSIWMVERENGKNLVSELEMQPSERFLIRVIDRGLNGEAIIATLRELEIEIIERCESQSEEFLELLPVKTLMPLLLFIFPAYLILLLGPLVERLVQSLN